MSTQEILSADDLTDQDIADLAALEAEVTENLYGFLKAGRALMEIRQRRLYLKTHTSWEDYCQEKWDMSDRHARRLIESVSVVEAIGPIGPVLTNETQVRAIGPVVKDHGPEVAAAVLQQVADQNNGKVDGTTITAAATAAGLVKPRTRMADVLSMVEQYIREHPGIGRNDVSAATGVDKSMVTKIATKIGHTWPQAGPSKAAVTKGGQMHTQKKPPPPPLSTVPLYQRADEVGAVMRFFHGYQAMASNNGRMHYAQHIMEAMYAGDTQWLAEQQEAAAYAAAYAADLARLHTDKEYREKLNTGWEGRDDIPAQQITTTSPQPLRAVSG